MDEPCSALDPIATLKIEELIDELKQRFTIVIVTHNMQQAARVADTTAFMLAGELVEHAPTDEVFTNPSTRAPRSTSPGSSADGGRERERASTSPTSWRARGAGRSAGWTSSSQQLDRVLEALEHQDVELAAMVIADDDRIDGRYLEVHQGSCRCSRCRRRSPATCGSSRRCCT